MFPSAQYSTSSTEGRGVTLIDILVVGDSHAKPGVSNRRFDWLGRYIAATKPSVVVDIGDSYDMESLSSYDKGKKSFEGRRYKKDIEAGQDAFNRVAHFAGKAAKRFKPRYIRLCGNHEARCDRVSEENPEFTGIITSKDCVYAGWEAYDFLHPVVVNGVSFSHYFASGRMGAAISGEYQAGTIIRKKFKSCVMGHSHIFDYCIRTAVDGTRIQGLVAGCYMDPKQYEDYAGPEANAMWWKGLVRLKNVADGAYALEQIPIETLEREYGGR